MLIECANSWVEIWHYKNLHANIYILICCQTGSPVKECPSDRKVDTVENSENCPKKTRKWVGKW